MKRFSGAFLLASLMGILFSADPAAARDKSGLGKPAPNFTLSGFSREETVTLSALKGKVVLIDFWASWCHPCRQLMPRIAEIKTRFPDVEVVAISVDTDRDKALTFVRAVEPGLRPVHDSAQKVSEAYRVERMPSSFLIDKQGVLRFRHDGYGAKALVAVERQLQLLLNE
ncbi:MAG: Thioredoxin-like protein [Fibrobacteria bacterium]|jgi:thiol-disulfide isomerase/thioredoxin|nr:Thioredoxin-like protein [Fibrobacteria bacterium]